MACWQERNNGVKGDPGWKPGLRKKLKLRFVVAFELLIKPNPRKDFVTNPGPVCSVEVEVGTQPIHV